MPVTYSDEVLDALRGRPVLSCSLPVSNRRVSGRNFFDGVLPEGQFRAALAARANVAANDTYGLLAAFGRDIAGALVVDDVARVGSVGSHGSISLSDDDLEREVAELPSRPLGVHDDSELSIAGLQNKMLLVETAHGWARPTGGAPSTHILKVDSQVHPGVVRAEAEAMALARLVGLTSVEADVVTLAGVECIVVERFDRTVDESGDVRRIHQEDICQALGYPPTQKYELPGRGRPGRGGGPEFADVAMLLDRHAANPAAELDQLARVATFTALIGNADAHGKNLSLLHAETGRVTLAPLYDTVPTNRFPKLKSDAAMTIGGAVDLEHVTRLSLRTEAKHWNVDPDRMVSVSEDLAEALLAEAPLVLSEESALRSLVEQRAHSFLTSKESH